MPPRSRPSLAGATGLRILVLLAVSVALGAAANLLRSDPLPWMEDWSNRIENQAAELGIRVADVEQTTDIIEAGMHFLFDARPAGDFAAGHLPTAMSLPSAQFDERFLEVAGFLIPEQEILVYCSGFACDESLLVCEDLQAQGFTNLTLFVGGFEAWTDAGLPVEEGQ